jgi:Cys-tRNA(Pro)/Cys-tRNA(Cys) deacylase
VLRAAGVDFAVHRHPPIRTHADLEHLMAFPLERSVKTLVFSTPADRVVLVAIPGFARISYGSLARAIGVPRGQLEPAPASVLERLGMEPGGASPICRAEGLTVVFDAVVPEMGTVYTGSGKASYTIEVAADVLVRLVDAPVIAQVTSTQ